MRKTLLATASVVGLSLSASFGAQGATIITVPTVPGAVTQTVFGINDSNVIAGSFKDSAGVEHGFFGTLDGNFTTFDVSGTGTVGTEARAISRDGSIAGFAPASGFAIGEEFFRRSDGSVAFPQRAGIKLDGVLQGTNFLHISMGDYFNSQGVRVGYFDKNGHYEKNFHLHFKKTQQNSPRKITDDEQTFAGYFIDRKGGEHGFVQKVNVRPTLVIDHPSAILTVLEDINDSATASGQWDDSSGNPHSFSLDTTTGTFTDITIDDGSTFQQAWGMNNQGLIAISTSIGVSYIYCPLPDDQCPTSGKAAKVHPIHVAPGTFLKYNEYGETSRKLPPANSIKKKGAIQ